MKKWTKITIHNPEWYELYGLYKQQAAGDYDHAREQVSAKPQQIRDERVKAGMSENLHKTEQLKLNEKHG